MLKNFWVVVVFILFALAHSQSNINWSSVDQSIKDAIGSRVFPGCVVIIGNATTTLYANAYGTLSYRQDIYEQPVRNDTLYDVASLTKAMGTTAAILTLYNSHLLSLEDPVAKYIPDYDSRGKRIITIGHLLLHCGGLPYDYPG
jgi:CubicO group peptidase (beta-lactamase class C family)